MNRENGRVCEYFFFTMNVPVKGVSGATAPQRVVNVACSSVVDTIDPADTK
jgi:hypothetical protein